MNRATSPRAFRRWIAWPFALGAALVALCLGPSPVGASEVVAWLTGSADAGTADILGGLRLPRVGLGLLVGGALALSGTILQALFRNDLAEPYLVGVGPGALLGITVAALTAGGAAVLPPATVRTAFALAGAGLVCLVVFSFARRGGRNTGPTLLLAGVALGAFVSALATAALYVAVPEWHRVIYWLLGHLGPRPAEDLWIVGGALALAFGFTWIRARDLDAVALGEEGAWLLGVDVRRLLLGAGLAACLAAAAAVSVAGLIGFVGLLVPHLARRLVGPEHRVLLPTAVALGAGLLVLADAVARVAHPPLELPVGVVTAALGAPFLAWVLLRSR